MGKYEKKRVKKSRKKTANGNKKLAAFMKKPVGKIAVIVLAVLLVVGGYLGIRSIWAANNFRKLSNKVQQDAAIAATDPARQNRVTQPTEATAAEGETKPSGAAETQPQETVPVVRTILPQYENLYLENTEMFGWIRIDGTKIDYPVMRSFDDPEKYLHANFYGEYSYPGIPFADTNCSHDSDNILIYGNNMLDGSMFRSLIKYESKTYWEKHPIIMFSDLYADYEYEIVAAFYDRVYLKTDTCFKFYQFIDAENEEDFDYAISQFREKALYDTGVDVEYGDHLITLVTCAYHVENGRFVVVARRK